MFAGLVDFKHAYYTLILFRESAALIRWFRGLLGKTGYDVFDRRGTDLLLRSLIAFSGNWI